MAKKKIEIEDPINPNYPPYEHYDFWRHDADIEKVDEAYIQFMIDSGVEDRILADENYRDRYILTMHRTLKDCLETGSRSDKRDCGILAHSIWNKCIAEKDGRLDLCFPSTIIDCHAVNFLIPSRFLDEKDKAAVEEELRLARLK